MDSFEQQIQLFLVNMVHLTDAPDVSPEHKAAKYNEEKGAEVTLNEIVIVQVSSLCHQSLLTDHLISSGFEDKKRTRGLEVEREEKREGGEGGKRGK